MVSPGRTVLALAVLTGLASMLAYELSRDDQNALPDATPARPPPTAPISASSVLAETHEQSVVTILARPLFTPDRRPQAATVVAQQAAPAPTLPRVAGIVVVGGSRRVIFAATGPGRPLVVPEGGDVNGFRVQSIEPGRITVAGPDGTRTLLPSFESQSPGTSAAPPVQPPPTPPQAMLPPGLPALLPPRDLVPGAAPLPDRLPPPPAQVVGMPSNDVFSNGLQVPGMPPTPPAH